ncbi:heparan-alpha-glucosaminide N-acetyltransferase domain-containing protein [Modestobacter sp. SYSU DS0875]
MTSRLVAPPRAVDAAPPPVHAPVRLRGVDALRGLAVVGMLAVDNRGNDRITRQLQHAEWDGLHVADVVFPVFLVVVGVSMPFSRRATRPCDVLVRVLKLGLLGWLVVTAKYGLGATGAGVLGHIAGAYLLCWLLLRLPRAVQPVAAVAVLAGLTLATQLAGASPARSWGQAVDGALGVPFSAEAPHSYVGSAITVFIGVLAGRALQSATGHAVLARLAGGGTALLVTGLALTPLTSLNKRLWSPSFVLVTGGIAVLALAALHWLADQRGVRRPLRPAEVLGANAIVAFVFSELVFRAALGDAVQPAVDSWVTGLVGATPSAWLYAAASVAVVWAVCALLLRRGVVVRV